MPDFSSLNKTDLITFLQKVAYMAEAKEWDNSLHVERIRHYVLIMANGAGLPFSEAEDMSIASILHDIGKSLIPENLLDRKGKFSPDEWKIIEQHTVLGKKLLEGNGAFIMQTAEAMAYGHHERWDGSGYPQKLTGQETPYSARMCALADVFDALTTPRSYKKTIQGDEALHLIQESGGKSFDPDLVRVFQSTFKDIEAIRLRYWKLATSQLRPL